MTTRTAGSDIAHEVSRYCRSLTLSAVPSIVRESAELALANIIGVAIGGARTETVAAATRWARLLGGPEQAHALGVPVRAPADRIALLDGIAAHVLDFDDTHLETVYHPSAPVIAGLLPVAEWKGATGTQVLTAWIAGLEVGCRAAIALGKEHYDTGWHVTGTAGVLASAASCAMILELDETQFANALGIAATLASGHREQFGSMTKSLHAGAAGSHGLTAALLASQGYDATAGSIEGKRGMLNVMSTSPRPERLATGLGTTWELLGNAIKPYACGVVTHPVIDATRALRDEHGLSARDIRSIVIKVHPLVTELTGKAEPTSELEAKFSAVHCAAVGLLRGQAGPDEFSRDTVFSPEVIGLRRKIELDVEPGRAHLTTSATAVTTDGRTIAADIIDARGTLNRPLTLHELESKFVSLAAPAVGEQTAKELFTRFHAIDREPSIAALVRSTAPDAATARAGR